MAHDIRFATGDFHFMERPEFVGIGLQTLLNLVPADTLVAAHVFLEAGFQRDEQLLSLLWCQFPVGFGALAHDG
jgi:hypothetical protein